MSQIVLVHRKLEKGQAGDIWENHHLRVLTACQTLSQVYLLHGLKEQVIIPTFIEYLACARHCAKHVNMNSLNPHNNPIGTAVIPAVHLEHREVK